MSDGAILMGKDCAGCIVGVGSIGVWGWLRDGKN